MKVVGGKDEGVELDRVALKSSAYDCANGLIDER